MASVSSKTATPVMPPAFFPHDVSSAMMTTSTQTQEKTRSTLVDGMPPAPPPSPVAFAKGSKKGSYASIPSLSLE
jgi:hypothetical protein